ncbi:MAG: hypothetical protein FWE40_07245 [Oscillospiraceae bacterium]|nr:hypothetical protein [Oscillospiraceae bacterium]
MKKLVSLVLVFALLFSVGAVSASARGDVWFVDEPFTFRDMPDRFGATAITASESGWLRVRATSGGEFYVRITTPNGQVVDSFELGGLRRARTVHLPAGEYILQTEFLNSHSFGFTMGAGSLWTSIIDILQHALFVGIGVVIAAVILAVVFYIAFLIVRRTV